MKVRRQSLDEARLTLPQRSKQRLMKSFEEKNDMGVTLHQVTAELDGGPILRQYRFLEKSENTYELQNNFSNHFYDLCIADRYEHQWSVQKHILG